MNVKQHCIKIAAKAGNKTLVAKLALLANVENDGRGVFLGNAYGDVREYLTPIEWRQALSVLARQGFYRASQDKEYVGHFGYINSEE